MVTERMVKRFAGVIWALGRHFILHPELFERCKLAMQHVKEGNFESANRIMNEVPATRAIWAEALK